MPDQVPSPPRSTRRARARKARSLKVCKHERRRSGDLSITSSNPDSRSCRRRAAFRREPRFLLPSRSCSPEPRRARDHGHHHHQQRSQHTGAHVPTPPWGSHRSDDDRRYRQLWRVLQSNKFKDLMVTIDNRGTCPLLVTALSSSAGVPGAAGADVPASVRWGQHRAAGALQPTSSGPKSATLSISTNDPAAPVKLVTLPDPCRRRMCACRHRSSIEAAVGPTFGSARTGNSVNTTATCSDRSARTAGSACRRRRVHFYPAARKASRYDPALSPRPLAGRGRWELGDANLRSEVQQAR